MQESFADVGAQLVALRPMLVRMARQRVRNAVWAEDAVSETLLAALERPQALAGAAHARPWLVGVLHHKLVDQVRRHTRECALQPLGDDEDDALDQRPAGAAGPEPAAGWGDPQEHLAQRQFVARVDACLRQLPPRQGRAFVLREWLGEETEAVCRELDVSANHLGVMLHRARTRLRSAVAPARRARA